MQYRRPKHSRGHMFSDYYHRLLAQSYRNVGNSDPFRLFYWACAPAERNVAPGAETAPTRSAPPGAGLERAAAAGGGTCERRGVTCSAVPLWRIRDPPGIVVSRRARSPATRWTFRRSNPQRWAVSFSGRKLTRPSECRSSPMPSLRCALPTVARGSSSPTFPMRLTVAGSRPQSCKQPPRTPCRDRRPTLVRRRRRRRRELYLKRHEVTVPLIGTGSVSRE